MGISVCQVRGRGLATPTSLLPFSDDFNRSDRTLHADNGWVQYSGKQVIAGNQARWIANSYDIRFAQYSGTAALGVPYWDSTSDELVTVEADIIFNNGTQRATGLLFIGAGDPEDVSADSGSGDYGLMFEFAHNFSLWIYSYNQTTQSYEDTYNGGEGLDWPDDFPGRVFRMTLTYDPPTRTAKAYVDGTLVITHVHDPSVLLGNIVGFASLAHDQFRAQFGEQHFTELIFDNFNATGTGLPGPAPEIPPAPDAPVPVTYTQTAFLAQDGPVQDWGDGSSATDFSITWSRDLPATVQVSQVPWTITVTAPFNVFVVAYTHPQNGYTETVGPSTSSPYTQIPNGPQNGMTLRVIANGPGPVPESAVSVTRSYTV